MRRLFRTYIVALHALAMVLAIAAPCQAQMTLTGAGCAAAHCGGGGGLDPATTAWVNAVVSAGGAVSPTQKTRVDTLIKALKSHSYFTRLDRVWLHAGESDAHQAAIDIINLAVATPHGTIPLSAGGYTGDGSTGYLATGFLPSTSGVNFTAASAMLGVYVVSQRTTGGNQYHGVQDAGSGIATFMATYEFGGSTFHLNNGSAFSGATGGTNGLWALTQLSGTAAAYNASATLGRASLTSLGSAANASPAINVTEIFMDALNSGGTPVNFNTDQIAMTFLGNGFNSTDLSGIAADLNAYMMAWGVNQF